VEIAVLLDQTVCRLKWRSSCVWIVDQASCFEDRWCSKTPDLCVLLTCCPVAHAY